MKDWTKADYITLLYAVITLIILVAYVMFIGSNIAIIFGILFFGMLTSAMAYIGLK